MMSSPGRRSENVVQYDGQEKGAIYVIQPGTLPFFKIGWSAHPKKRIKWYSATADALELLHVEFGVVLEVTTIDETVLLQRVDTHRRNLLSSIERAKQEVHAAESRLQKMIDQAEDFLLLLAEHDVLVEISRERRAARRLSRDLDPTTFEGFVGRLFGTPSTAQKPVLASRSKQGRGRPARRPKRSKL